MSRIEQTTTIKITQIPFVAKWSVDGLRKSKLLGMGTRIAEIDAWKKFMKFTNVWGDNTHFRT